MKVLVIDVGCHVDTARMIAKEGHEVFYFCQFGGASPKFQDGAPGYGVPELKKVLEFGSYLDQVDLICVFHVGFGDLVSYLRTKGYRVFGAGKGEVLEMDRGKSVEIMKSLGIACPETVVVKGVREALKFFKSAFQVQETNQSATGKYFVKLNTWRGTQDSFPVENPQLCLYMLKGLQAKFGPYAESMELIIQKTVEGRECGFDAIFDGKKFLKPTLIGFEKGNSYVGCMVNDFSIFNQDMEKFAEYLSSVDYRGYFSTECFYDGNQCSYIDITCFDDKTEVLTKDGWKFWKDVTADDYICCLNPNGKHVFYEQPSRLISYHREGEMIQIRSDSSKSALDIVVTPDHQMYVKKQQQDHYQFIRADELPSHCKIPRTGNWQGIDLDSYTVQGFTREWHSGKGRGIDKQYVHPDIKIDATAWFRFLGAYLTDGGVGGYSGGGPGHVTLTQTKYVEEFEEIIQETGLPYSKTENGFQISIVSLATELGQFGKKPERYVPNYVKNASPRLITAFLDAYCLGDGSRRENAARRLYTPSKRMADDLQELFLKVGSLASITFKPVAGTIATFGDQEYERKCDMYQVNEKLYKSEYIVEKQNIKKIPYNGMVYCAEVSTHVMFVRRNGEAFWCGNCRSPMPLGLLYPSFMENFTEFLCEVADGNASHSHLKAGTFLGGIAIASENAMTEWLPLTVGANTRLMGYLMQGEQCFCIPGGDATVAMACAMGSSMEEVEKNAQKEAETSTKGIFFSSATMSFVKEIRESYIEPLKELGYDYDKLTGSKMEPVTNVPKVEPKKPPIKKAESVESDPLDEVRELLESTTPKRNKPPQSRNETVFMTPVDKYGIPT